MELVYTYKLGRKCLHCAKPIADQAHAAIKFCPKRKLSDGAVLSCKDDYHSPKRKTKNAPYKSIADFHKQTHKNILSLWKNKGENVSLDDLNQYRIRINRCVEWIAQGDDIWTFNFIEFAITQLPNKKYKITKHGRNY